MSDKPTIGLILCQHPNLVLTEYALQNRNKKICVSDFDLTRTLPEELQSSLPTIEQIVCDVEGENHEANH